MNWDSLQDFLAIFRARSLAGAARRRGVNHSTMFRRLGAIESALGARLFERLAEGYRLTEAGERLLPFAERIEDQATSAQRVLENADTAPRGVVRLTAPGNLAYRYLPAYLCDFHRRYPGIRVELVVTNEDLNLARREADLALRATRQPPDYLVGRRIFQLGWGVYATHGLLERLGAPAGLEELEHFPVIGAESRLWYLPACRWLEDNLPAGQVIARASDLVAMAALARAGLGLAILPDDHNEPPLERLFDFAPAPASGFWLLTHPDLRDTGRIRLLMDHLTECFRADTRFGGLVDSDS